MGRIARELTGCSIVARGRIVVCVQWLLNDEFAAAFQRVIDLQQRKGLALVDIVRELTPCVYPCPRPAYATSGWTGRGGYGGRAVASAPLLPTAPCKHPPPRLR